MQCWEYSLRRIEYYCQVLVELLWFTDFYCQPFVIHIKLLIALSVAHSNYYHPLRLLWVTLPNFCSALKQGNKTFLLLFFYWGKSQVYVIFYHRMRMNSQAILFLAFCCLLKYRKCSLFKSGVGVLKNAGGCTKGWMGLRGAGKRNYLYEYLYFALPYRSEMETRRCSCPVHNSPKNVCSYSLTQD